MCEGKCSVQFYDVDFGGITVTPDPSNGAWCPATPPLQEIIDTVQSYFVKIECKDADCVCDLYDHAPEWLPWQEYDAPSDPVLILIGGDLNKGCKYTLTGTYQVSTCIQDGLCIKKPKGWKGYPRRKNPKRPKWAKKEGGEKSEHGPKKKKRSPRPGAHRRRRRG